MKTIFICLVCLGFISACTTGTSKIQAPARISFITVEPGVSLEIIDWGGKGEPVLFLAGLGNTAHVFDNYAPQFNDQFRVFGLTRRGFGASGRPSGGYHIDTLAKDILSIIDSLGIEKIILIGHSIAGEEMSRFAVLYPGRLSKLIYLDAAYDRTADLSFADKAPPSPIKMSADDSATWQNYQRYLKKTFRLDLTEAEIRAITSFDSNGRLVGDATPDSIFGSYISAVAKPDYAAITVPVLAMYNVADSVSDIFSYYQLLDTAGKSVADEVYRIGQQFQRGQIEDFKKQVKNGKVIEFRRADHYLFFSNPGEVAMEIRKFLSGN